MALRPVLDLLFPALCPVCGARSDEPRRRPFCGACWVALPLAPTPGCRTCGRTWPGLSPGLVCDGCRRHPPPFAYARAVGEFRDGMRAAIHAMKYGRRPAVARPLGRLLAEAGGPLVTATARDATAGAPGEVIDAIVPVPLHPARVTERGFNQAELLAVPCATLWGVPLRPRALVRVRPTRPQTELDASARRANVAGAFEVTRPEDVTGRRLLLVDDVLTTGATVGAAARALKAAGAEIVGVLVLARVPDG